MVKEFSASTKKLSTDISAVNVFKMFMLLQLADCDETFATDWHTAYPCGFSCEPSDAQKV